MEQEQSEVIEYFVKKTVASSNANALVSVLVEATSHRNLFTFSEILSLPCLQQVLIPSLFSSHFSKALPDFLLLSASKSDSSRFVKGSGKAKLSS